ncbi:molybdopterin guanine dinucleotide-containing S/N-oxide reductase [Geminicoccaceae bacterium 1502E]|nr:molybdopterin guanine dinucleotide-containing S/N-oxide reductase [Geminicoccaceae bacterium 1502E]
MTSAWPTTATHWGTYRGEVREGRLVALHPFERDCDPSPIAGNMIEALDHPLRIRKPAVRLSWLRHGHEAGGRGRGREPFVEVGWETALDLVAKEIARVRERHGNQAIFGGSYGWGSAGRFHHAQSQIHRFLNCIGGYTRSVNAYSYAAAQVIVPRVIGSFQGLLTDHTSWRSIAESGELVVMFGGMPLKNGQVNSGGVGRHVVREGLERCREAGLRFVLLAPVRADAADLLDAEWLPFRPGTDAALMLGLAHTLLAEGLHDRRFLERCTTGFDRFAAYLAGESDGMPKDADWAAGITGLEAATIRDLARRMAASRTLISASWSVQRTEHGEQPYWLAITLAAMLGQIGKPGGGFGFGYSAANGIGNDVRGFPWPSVPQGENPVRDLIPVARIADLLLHPGEPFDFDGKRLTYPDTRLVYWAGGNPFHAHQDLNRLERAWQRPETVVVHEIMWNALAKRADIVLPATMPLEREDIACASNDGFMIAMKRLVRPVGLARDDHAIFRGLARRLGVEEAFTEGREPMDWLRWLYNVTRQRAAERHIDLPEFAAFWERGFIELPEPAGPRTLLEGFARDPEGQRLRTPSGRIEIFSKTIDGFAYDDCPGHPAWLEPEEWLGAAKAARFPLHLISSQPEGKLHSQYDPGGHSRSFKRQGREVLRLNPEDAAARGIEEGALVRVFNDRGACLATAATDGGLMKGVAVLPTGAWFDPDPETGIERHGNPNALTLDKGTSRLAQGPSAHSCLVEVELFGGEPPPVRAFEPPSFARA